MATDVNITTSWEVYDEEDGTKSYAATIKVVNSKTNEEVYGYSTDSYSTTEELETEVESIKQEIDYDYNVVDSDAPLEESPPTTDTDKIPPSNTLEAIQAAEEKHNEELAEAAAAAATTAAKKTKEQLNKSTVAYQEQSYLFANLSQLIDYKKNVLEKNAGKPLPYSGDNPQQNACLLVDGTPYAFMNKLTQYPNYKRFFEMKNAEISNLQPMIRLFKCIQDTNGDEHQVEMNFASYAGIDREHGGSYFKNKNKRGFGVGIRDFSFSFIGTDQFAAKKSITAKLTIFANDFEELLRCRGEGDCDAKEFAKWKNAYRYVDLALKTGGVRTKPEDATAYQKQHEDNLKKLNFRLKAVVGWAMPKNFPSSDSSDLREAINNSYITLNLTPTIHAFDMDEMGRVTFTINYLAYIEDFFDQSQYDVFASKKSLYNRDVRTAHLLAAKSKCSADEIKELQQGFADDVKAERKESIKNITRKLMEKDKWGSNTTKLQYLVLTVAAIKDFQQNGLSCQPAPLGENSTRGKVTSSSAEDYMAIESGINESMASESDPNAAPSGDSETTNFTANMISTTDNFKLPFFYVSDLVDIIMESIGESLTEASSNKFLKRFEKLRIVLGPLEIVDTRGSQQSTFCSLGDLPISLKYFMEWLSFKTLKQADLKYNMSTFLNDFFNDLIVNYLNNDTWFKLKGSQKIRLNKTSLTSYKQSKDTPDEITAAILQQGSDSYFRLNVSDISPAQMPILRISGVSGLPVTQKHVSAEVNYFIFSAGRVRPTEKQNGDIDEDSEHGIFHYLMGKDSGLVKKISLQKTDAAGLKELRFEQSGYDGLEQLLEVYDVTVDAFPIVTAFPGTYIYVDPRGWLPGGAVYGSGAVTDITRYGIGGYCMVWKSEHFFGVGRAETKLHAKWVAGLHADTKDSALIGDGTDITSPATATDSEACAELAETRAAVAAFMKKIEDDPTAGGEIPGGFSL